MGGKISKAYKMAKLGVDMSGIDKQREEAAVLEKVDNAFYQVIELEEQVLSAVKYQKAVEEFLRQVKNAFSEGMKTRNDVMKINVRYNEAKLLHQKASNGLSLAKMNLCYIIGLPITTKDITLQNPVMQIEQITSNNTLDITTRPEYALLTKQVKAKELEAKITKGEHLPTVAAIANYGYSNGLKLNGNKLIGQEAFSTGVVVNIPIFHWAEGRKKTSAKEREANIARNTLADLSMQMQLELIQATNEVNEAITQILLTKEAEKQAEENMRLSKNQYEIGLETIGDYLESQALWQKAMSNSSSARREQRVAYTKYLKTIGQLKP